MTRLKERAKQIENYIPVVFIAMKSKDTPVIAKVMACITIGYALSPIDLIPDFIPVLGYLDDLILLPIFIVITIKLIPKDIWEKYKKEAEELRMDGKLKRWHYAIPILLIWILVVWGIIKAFRL